MSPVRVQQSRSLGWRKPENTVVVSRPSKWGNPYKVSPNGDGWSVSYGGVLTARFYTREEATVVAVKRFESRLLNDTLVPFINGRLMFDHVVTAAMVREHLRGKNLACWCPLPKPGERDVCHAAVLLDVANSVGLVRLARRFKE